VSGSRRAPLARRPSRNLTGSQAYALLRMEVHAREGGFCVKCLDFEPVTFGECHHRKLRSRGGRDTAWNCIWLCKICHEWVHANPAEATTLGLLVPSWEDPAGWPVQRRTGWFQPSPDGWLPSAQRVEQETS